MIYLLAPLKSPIIPLYTGIERLQLVMAELDFFIKHTVSFQLNDLCPSNASHVTFDSLFISISQKKGPQFILGTIYRPPGQNLKTFNEEFSALLSELTKVTIAFA